MFLVTYGTDGAEIAHEVGNDYIKDFVANLVTLPDTMENGDFIQIRRADYLDTKKVVEVVYERPRLTIIQGGKH